MIQDPLTAAQRMHFEKQLVIAWRREYAEALRSGAFDKRMFGGAGDSTVAKAALQRVFCEVFQREGVVAAFREWPK